MFSPAHKLRLRAATIPPDCDYSPLLLRMGVSVRKTEKYVGNPGELGKPFKCSKENTNIYIWASAGRSVGEKHPDRGSLSTKSPPPPLASPFSGILPQEPVLSASWRGGVPGSWRPRESRAAGCRACPHPSSRAYGGQPGPGRIPSRRPAMGDARPGSRSTRRSCAPGSPAPAPRRRLCRPPGVMNGRSGSPAPPGRDARPMAARAAWMDEVSAVVSGMECVSVTFRTG